MPHLLQQGVHLARNESVAVKEAVPVQGGVGFHLPDELTQG